MTIVPTRHELHQLLRCSLIVWLASVVLACDTAPGESHVTGSADSSGVLSVSVPDILQRARALDLDTLQLNVLVNSREIQTVRDGDTWSVQFTVAPNTPYELSIIWRNIGGLLLARLDTTQPGVQSDVTQAIDSSQYVTHGESQFDADDDGVSNLAELKGEFDPFDPNNPRRLIKAELNRIEPANAPLINGLYDSIWDDAQFSDTEGNTLAINRLLGGTDPHRSDGNTEFRWAAMHDGVNLYLLIFGENESVPGVAPIGDSPILFHDDAIELFFDGNYSQGSEYDGVDDTSIIIALLDDDGNSTGRISQGASDSQPIPADIKFANCLCSPEFTWEVSIPLASLNIDPDRTFGMEVQLNDDNDGGDREAYWGWVQSSETSPTFFVPAVMGAISLR